MSHGSRTHHVNKEVPLSPARRLHIPRNLHRRLLEDLDMVELNLIRAGIPLTSPTSKPESRLLVCYIEYPPRRLPIPRNLHRRLLDDLDMVEERKLLPLILTTSPYIAPCS